MTRHIDPRPEGTEYTHTPGESEVKIPVWLHLVMLALIVIFATMLVSWVRADESLDECAPHDAMVRWLAEDHDERQIGLGISRDDRIGASLDVPLLVEVFMSDSTGTWTIVFTGPEGISCLAASGESWSDASNEFKPTGEPL